MNEGSKLPALALDRGGDHSGGGFVLGDVRWTLEQLLYCSHTERLIARHRGPSQVPHAPYSTRVYAQAVKSGGACRRICDPAGPDETTGHLVLAGGAPYLFYSVWRWLTVEGYPEVCGAECPRIMRVDLRSDEETEAVHAGSLAAPDGGRVWISELLGASADGSQLFAQVGVEERGVNYYLCSIDLRSLKLERVTELQRTFY